MNNLMAQLRKGAKAEAVLGKDVDFEVEDVAMEQEEDKEAEAEAELEDDNEEVKALEEGIESSPEDIKVDATDLRDVRRLDFRYGELPPGLSFHVHPAFASKASGRVDLMSGSVAPSVPAAPSAMSDDASSGFCQLHRQPGAAAHLSLSAGSYVRVDLSSLSPSVGDSKEPLSSTQAALEKSHKTASSSSQQTGYFEEWTLSMDVKFDELPGVSQAILQCHADHQHLRHTVESLLYATGGVGVFEETTEDPSLFMQPGQWTRLTLRFGPALSPASTGSSSGSFGRPASFGDDPHVDTARFTLRGRGMPYGGAGGVNPPMPRVLTVFVNGKKALELKKGVFDARGGRFSIPRAGFLLFAGQDAQQMHGVHLRYLEFVGRALSDSQVKKAQHASVYSQWQTEAAQAKADRLASLALRSLYKRPPFVWQEMSYICEFGDAKLEGTGLEGACSIFSSVRTMAFVVQRMLEEQQGSLDALSPLESQLLQRSFTLLNESVQVARMYMLSRKNPNQLIAFIRKFRKLLEDVKVGAAVMVPGAFAYVTDNGNQRFSPFVLLMERISEDAFRVTVVNTADGSEQYHFSSSVSQPPKIQTRLTMAFDNVPREKVLCDGWWFMFWRLGFAPMAVNTPDRFYDDLLPLLLGCPLEAALRDNHCNSNENCFPLRTNQRADVTGYRCCREAWVYFLLRGGMTPQHALHAYFVYQQQWLKLLLHDLHCTDEIEESDLRLIRLSTQQLAHLCTRRTRSSDPPRFLAEQLADVRATVDGIEARIPALRLRSYGAATQYLELDSKDAGPLRARFETTRDLANDVFDRADHDGKQQSPAKPVSRPATCQEALRKAVTVPAIQDVLLPFFERLLRKEDVNGLAGPPKQQAHFVPIDFLLVAEQATTFDAAIDAMRWADKLCTLVSVQGQRVKNPAFFKVALLQHLFTRVLPVPDRSKMSECIWHAPMRYALQLDVLLLLKRLLEHFCSSAFAINTSREFDAVKIVVGSVVLTIADVFLRKVATDIPSEVSQVWNRKGFAVRLHPFDEQSETIMVTVPEINIARTQVLDYWHDLNAHREHCTIFNFNGTVPCFGCVSVCVLPHGCCRNALV